MGRVREEKRREEERRSEKRKSQKKEDAGARKGRKGALCFPIICGSGKSKSRLAKAAGAEPLPFLTTSHGPHLPSSPLPFITTSLSHHFPSSPLPIVTTSHRRHVPSSPPPFVTTLCHTFLFYVMYHPSSRSILL